MTKKRKSQVYHPQSSQQKRQKTDENGGSTVNPNKKDYSKLMDQEEKPSSKMNQLINTMLDGQFEVTLLDYSQSASINQSQKGINIYAGQHIVKVETQNQYQELDKQSLKFDFNSKQDFNPDTDCTKVALKLWDYLLNPLKFLNFQKTILNKHKVLVIQRGGKGFNYDQQDPEDNIISKKIIDDYLKMQVPQGNIKYSDQIELFKYVNGKKFSMNLGESVDSDYLEDQLQNQSTILQLNKAQEFSISLAKVMSLSDELFASDITCQVFLQHYLTQDRQKKNQLSEMQQNEFDQYIFMIDGSVGLRFFNNQDEKTPVFKVKLQKGDFAYIPRNVKYQTKTEIVEDDQTSEQNYCLYITLSHQSQQTWFSLIQKQMIELDKSQKLSEIVQSSLPADIYEKGKIENQFTLYKSAIDKLAEQLKSKDAFEHQLHKIRVYYLVNRQAPQEMIQPNETEEDDLDEESKNQDDDEEMNDEKFEQIKLKAQQQQQQQIPVQNVNKLEQVMQAEEPMDFDTNFNEVKLCSKNGAFMKSKKVINEQTIQHKVKFSGDDSEDHQFFLYFSTQNTRIKGEIPKQKLEVPHMFAKHVDKIINAYPNYINIKEFKETEDPEGLKAFLGELAYLQILIVN
eukprot:403358106